MFACNRTSPFVLLDALNTLQTLQQQQYQEHLKAQKPKIVRKIETEDAYRIEIYKQNGNFNSYELTVLRTLVNKNLVNLIVESEVDDFKKVFQFSLADIDVQGIDWYHYKEENVLVLNVPKKVKFCSDDFTNSVLTSIFSLPYHYHSIPDHERKSKRDNKALKKKDSEARLRRKERREAEQKREEQLQREAARQAQIQLELARQLQIKQEAERQAELKREAERQEVLKREAEKQAQLRKEAELRREAERKAHVEAEKQRRLQAIRARKAAEEKEQALRDEEENIRKANQEYLEKLLGTVFYPGFQALFQPVNVTATKQAQPLQELAQENKPSEDTVKASEDTVKDDTQATPTSESPPTSKSPESETQQHSDPSSERSTPASSPELSMEDENELTMTDSESITSDNEKPGSVADNSLKRHTSLEEVEDEEFVVLRKKFGEQN